MRKAQIYIKKYEKGLKNKKYWEGVSSPNWGGGVYAPPQGMCKNITALAHGRPHTS